MWVNLKFVIWHQEQEPAQCSRCEQAFGQDFLFFSCLNLKGCNLASESNSLTSFIYILEQNHQGDGVSLWAEIMLHEELMY